MHVLTPAVTAGFELPTVSKKFRLEDFKRGDEKTIHTDHEAAAMEGLPAPVAIGPQVAALIFRQMRLCFGVHWLTGSTWNLSFRRPVFVTDFCVARGVVKKTEIESEQMRIHCEVWIENQDGEKVIAGATSGLLPLPAQR